MSLLMAFRDSFSGSGRAPTIVQPQYLTCLRISHKYLGFHVACGAIMGTENLLVATLMEEVRGVDSYIWGK